MGRLRTFEPGLHESIRYYYFSTNPYGHSNWRPPPALTEKDVQAAKAMLADPDITVEEVAGRLKVVVSNLYRHLPGCGHGFPVFSKVKRFI